MMASPSEQSLDCKPHSYSLLLKSIGEQTDQTQKLEEILSRLEEERLKIDAFKRELPLCMQLLTNAMETSRQQLQNYRVNQGPQPVLEEFIPLKISEGSEKTSNLTMSDNKATWMTSAQLWSQASNNDHHQGIISNQNSAIVPILSPKETDHISFNTVISPKLGLDAKPRNGGAFLPFSKKRNSCPSPLHALPDLALANSTEKDVEDKKCLENDNCSRREKGCNGTIVEQGERKGCNGAMVEQGERKGGGDVVADNHTTTNGAPTSSQTHRKARRCWSHDLHLRFVNALQMLGGSQVATPKQIRELMKVDGLTNDEVKSHLQKYRLHTRRPSPSPQNVGNPQPQLVVLGGIWVPPEYATAGGPQLYGAHPTTHANPHYCGAQQVPQEFYAAPVVPPQLHHHHALHHQLHHRMYKPSSQNQSSPESDGRGGTGNWSESIEDGKSESGGSWKAASGGGGGENGGERKGLGLREEGEESNGSEITLKF